VSSNSNELDRNDESEVPVGYGNPPLDTRFRKGVSGNPRGRPKGSRNVAAVFAKSLREKVVVNENGQRKSITKLEAAIKQLVNKAAFGDHRSVQLIVNLSREAEAHDLSSPERSALGEFDQSVMESIVRRFSNVNNERGEDTK
jgi:hypothetical protein